MIDISMHRELVALLGQATPLRFDCGRLCGAACCRVTEELPGMYLFPGEEALFAGLPGFTLSQATLPGYGPVKLLCCGGSCDRASRPLSCRVFPLAPLLEGETVTVRMDPRGRAACPLCLRGTGALSAGFTQAVREIFAALMADPEARRFLAALSGHLDEFAKPL